MKQNAVLALDLGTTGNRAIVFDRQQRPLVSAYREFPQIFPKPGWVEHDPEAIWRTTRDVIARALAKVPARRLAAIGITNQRETLVVWDRKTGRPAHRAIVWQCRRSAPICQRLKARGLEPMIHRKTGLFLDAYFSASKLLWLFENIPGLRRSAARGELLCGTVDSWILWKLTGGRTHATDVSNASRTLLFDLRKKTWDPDLLRIFGVPASMLPEVVPSSKEVALTRAAAIGCELPVASLVGDQQAALFAQGCFGPGPVKNTYGTGLFLMENTGSRPRFSKNLLTTVAWALGDLSRIRYAVEGSVFIGGAALQWLRDGLGILRRAGESEALARGLGSNEGVYFVPALVGLGAPYWDPDARGAIFGITRGTTRAHIARAALEAIAYQTQDVLEVLRRDTRKSPSALRVDGGATANDFLMQFQADLLGIPVERPRVLETTALGAAGLAGLATGLWRDPEHFASMRRIDRVFKPRRSRSEARRLSRLWFQAVRRTLGWKSNG